MSSITPLSPQDREKYRREKKNNANFWRALRYLKPYRHLVVISIVCAFFVGLAMTSGLGTILPIVRVLINGDTVPAWINRTIAEKRLGVKISDDPTDRDLRLVEVDKYIQEPTADFAGKYTDMYAAGFRPGDELAGHSLSEMSAPNRTSVVLGTHAIALKPVPFYLILAREAAAKLPASPVKTIAIIFGIMTLLAAVGNVIRFFQEYLSNKAAILAVNDIRRHLYDHVLRVSMSHFGEQGTSDVTSRLVQDASNLTDGFKQVLGQTIQEPIKVAMAFALVLWISWPLTLCIICFGVVLVPVVRKFGKKMYRASRKQLQESATMLGQLEATLLGIRVVKAAGAERFERRRYSTIMKALVHQQLRMSRIDAFNSPTMEMLMLVAAGCVVLFGAELVLVRHVLPPEQFIFIMVSLVTIADSLRRITKVNTALQQSNAAAARIFEAIDLPVEVNKIDRRRLIKLRPLTREIRFENVTFSYPNAASPAIDEVNLAVPKGQCVAIVGRNGSGKTTLLALLPRFYQPQSGRILLDGTDIQQASMRSLRGQISLVTQDSVIFPGTIAQNIAYGRPLASREEIESAARRAYAHDFIMKKAGGYDAALGELGGQLSGGEKQRLCIARAILRRSPILILDEATSQVDADSERLIQQAIDELIHEGPRTTFVIAHRFSTIQSADVIIVMDRGRIVGNGRHEELLASCPTYQQLYERQLLIAAPR